MTDSPQLRLKLRQSIEDLERETENDRAIATLLAAQDEVVFTIFILYIKTKEEKDQQKKKEREKKRKREEERWY